MIFGLAELLIVLAMLAPIALVVALVVVAIKMRRHETTVGLFADPPPPPT